MYIELASAIACSAADQCPLDATLIGNKHGSKASPFDSTFTSLSAGFHLMYESDHFAIILQEKRVSTNSTTASTHSRRSSCSFHADGLSGSRECFSLRDDISTLEIR